MERQFIKVLKIIEETYKATKRLFPQEEYGRLHSNYFKIPDKFTKALKGKEVNSLTVLQFYQYHKQFFTLELFRWCGLYHFCFLQLRTLLESVIKTYYVDTIHPKTDIKCKTEILKEIENQRIPGSKLIEMTDLQNKHTLKNLYKKLSEYLHTCFLREAQLAVKRIENGEEFFKILSFIMPKFKKCEPYFQKMFRICEEYICKTMDASCFIWLSQFPEIKNLFKKDSEIIEILKKYKNSLTLSLLK